MRQKRTDMEGNCQKRTTETKGVGYGRNKRNDSDEKRNKKTIKQTEGERNDEKRKFVIAAIVVLVVMAVVVANASASLCGDANDDSMIDMTDVITMWYDIADYPYPGAHTISNVWAADVNCDGEIGMTDVMTLWYDIADYPYVGAYEVNCCE